MLHSIYKETTPVPNVIFNRYLKILRWTELKVLLVILRQTYGWVDKSTGKRKIRDRISHTQFIEKTGLSRRTITRVVQSLVNRRLVNVGDEKGQILGLGKERRGKFLYYGFEQGHLVPKTNGMKSVGEILGNSFYNNKGSVRYPKQVKSEVLRSSGYQLEGNGV